MHNRTEAQRTLGQKQGWQTDAEKTGKKNENTCKDYVSCLPTVTCAYPALIAQA